MARPTYTSAQLDGGEIDTLRKIALLHRKRPVKA